MYFIGIGGTAMGNIACMLSQNGYNVSGSDKKLYPPMSDVLESHNIKVFENFSEENLIKSHPDLVVVGNVVARGNPEFEWLLETKKFPFTSLSAFIGDNILRDRFNIVVSGTHGKTTTTSLVTHILQQVGLDTGYMIGGVPIGFDSGAHLGTAKSFVIEGDEYDSALFDKRSKFIHYAPNVLVINNIEFDHADIFLDIDDVKRAFYNAIKIVPRNGFVVINGDDQNIADVIKNVDWTSIIRVGINENNDFIISNRKVYESGSKFTLTEKKPGNNIEISTPLFGEYNCRNCALATVASGLHLNNEHPLEFFKQEFLSRFAGVKRRQEEKFSSNNVVIIEDFGHHPTAIAKTIDALKEKHLGKKLIACFEPRSNTARTDALKDAFETCFNRADHVFFGNVFQKQNFTKFNELNVKDLSKKLFSNGINSHAFESNNELLCFLKDFCNRMINEKIVITFFSNGAFDGIPTELVDFLKSK